MANDNNIQSLLEEILTRIQHLQAANKLLLNLDEAANYLSVSRSYLYKLTSQRKLSYYCPSGKLIYFKREDLDNWVLNMKKASREEIERQADTLTIQSKNYIKTK